MRTNVGLIIDKSASMRSLAKGAIDDYNLTIETLKDQQKKEDPYHEIIYSLIECGIGFNAYNRISQSNLNIRNAYPIYTYDANGDGTPLFDAVIMAINNIQNIDYNKVLYNIKQQEAYLIMVITDGYNNRGSTTAQQLSKKIQELQATDHWTFVFRVPAGNKEHLVNLGIPEGNIIEWELSNRGLKQSTEQTQVGIKTYFDNRSRGLTSTKSFYTTDLSNIKLTDVKNDLLDITDKVDVAGVWTNDDDMQIRDFCKKYFYGYIKGNAFYQLTKPEIIQSYKKIIIKHLKKGKYFTNSDPTNSYSVRDMLKLPVYGEIKVHPGNHGDFEIYVQSTSVNRKVKKNTKILYWKVGREA